MGMTLNMLQGLRTNALYSILSFLEGIFRGMPTVFLVSETE